MLPLRFPDRGEDKTYRCGQRERCHRLILHRLVDGALEVARDFSGAGIAQLTRRLTGIPFNLFSRLLDLAVAVAWSERSNRPYWDTQEQRRCLEFEFVQVPALGDVNLCSRGASGEKPVWRLESIYRHPTRRGRSERVASTWS